MCTKFDNNSTFKINNFLPTPIQINNTKGVP